MVPIQQKMTNDPMILMLMLMLTGIAASEETRKKQKEERSLMCRDRIQAILPHPIPFSTLRVREGRNFTLHAVLTHAYILYCTRGDLVLIQIQNQAGP